ncbi:phosphoglycerate mutase [Fructilactobacillus fructivorans]|uniref:histidine phosphatase family protein n=1 Tax=Fructilactobacillus fructivorans TaxID=1614 RepID=UPI000704A80B|nr:histidine phosphatase family protein [Fructilactobacillus fructivorans]KRN12387.1 phosphoglycerate mutase [Fructilactobacillus fructivorans]
MAKFTLYVVRHGQTYFNIFNKLQGWSNSPLTTKGISGAKDTAKRLSNIKFVQAYCSDTTRAEDTAKIILNGNSASDINEPVVSPDFREQFYGCFEGLNMDEAWYEAGAPHGVPTFKDIVTKYNINTAKDYMKEADPFHMAENAEDYWKRLDQGLSMITHDKKIKDGDNALLISHGNTLLSLVERFSDGQYDMTKRPANGSITKMSVDGDQIKVTDYNK